MTAQPQLRETPPAPLPAYRSILLAADASDHANHGIREAVALAGLYQARVTGTHVYAAQMHDLRFRQMEGGLPEQFRVEDELERQRDIHDDLITRGLSIITDSYLDQAERACAAAGLDLARRPLDGKNYRALTRETNSGNYDLLVIGALGLGAIKGSRIGSVCDRVVRRSAIDCLVIRDPQRGLSSGPIVVAIDGSTRAFGGLLTALSLAQQWQVPLHVISAFDPYYHYVAFNRIAGVLSEEAGKVFRFKEQEKLHEEIIDSGLAKIYQGHLTVAQSIAADYGIEIHTQLLDGKAHASVEQYVRQLDPSLLIIGKLGVHADDELDIGSNAENLLRNVDCSVLLSQREFRPRVDVLAEATTSWTNEAQQRLAKAPDFVQNMARMAILRYAQERGHTVITERIVDEATAQLMPSRAEDMLQEIVDQKLEKLGSESNSTANAQSLPEAALNSTLTPILDQPMLWNTAAQALLDSIEDSTLRNNLKMRAEKKARAAKTFSVEPKHLEAFMGSMGSDSIDLRLNRRSIESDPIEPLHWTAAALARLMQAPEGFMRDMSKKRIEEYARSNAHTEITLETAEAGLAVARKAMETQMGVAGKANMAGNGKVSKCPFAGMGAAKEKLGSESNSTANAQSLPGAVLNPTLTPIFPQADPTAATSRPGWSETARQQLRNIPQGYCRDMTVTAAETIARQKGIAEISLDFIRTVLGTFSAGSKAIEENLPWDDAARARIAKAPDVVRGMLQREIEGWAKRNALPRVTEAAVEAVKHLWAERGAFHLDPDDPRTSD